MRGRAAGKLDDFLNGVEMDGGNVGVVKMTEGKLYQARRWDVALLIDLGRRQGKFQ